MSLPLGMQLGPWVSGEGPASSYDRMTAPWVLPPWIARDRDLLMLILEVAGLELDRMAEGQAEVTIQIWFTRATFTLADHERQAGLSVETGWTEAQRRARLLARALSFYGPIGLAMQRQVADAVGSPTLPTEYIGPGQWAVFKLADRGWPGDAAFDEAERRLGRMTPAAFGAWVAGWDDVLGLTYEQANKMRYEAVNVLTYEEVNG